VFASWPAARKRERTPRAASPPLRGGEGANCSAATIVGSLTRRATSRPGRRDRRRRGNAWLELVARKPERTNVIAWLGIVARREAIRLVHYDRRFAGARSGAPGRPGRGAAGGSAGGARRARARGATAGAAGGRGFQVSGHSYRQIAAELGVAQRTVEHELLRARAVVRQANREPFAV
jgi:hypothetical protein